MKFTHYSLSILFLISFLILSSKGLSQFSQTEIKGGLNSTKCHSVYHDSKGTMWFGTQDGLFMFDGAKFKIFQHESVTQSSISGNIIMDIKEDSLGNLWLASLDGGVNYFNRQQETFTTLNIDEKIVIQNNLHASSNINIENQNEIWIGTYNGGLHHFDINKNKLSSYSMEQFAEDNSDKYLSNSVIDILEDIENKDLLWIAGNNGLFCFNKVSKSFEGRYTIPQPEISKGNRRVSVLKLLMKDPGILWLGTWGRGLVKFDTNKRIIEKIYLPDSIKLINIWKNNIINGLLKKNDSEFWISDQIKGIGVFNIEKEFFSFDQTSFSFSKNEIENDEVFGIYEDRNKKLWSFYKFAGPKILNSDLKLFHPIVFQSNPCDYSFKSPVSCLAKDEKHQIVFAMFKGCADLYIYNTKNNSLKINTNFSAHSNQVDFNKIFISSDGRVWLFGSDIENNEAIITNFSTTNNNWLPYENIPLYRKHKKPFLVNDVYEDQNKNLWLGAANKGLIKINLNSNQVITYELPDNLVSSKISTITEDKKGNLWLGTYGSGVLTFDPKTESFTHYKHYPSKNYGLRHGYITDLITDKNGKIWVAFGTQGIQIIDPVFPDTQIMESVRYEGGLPDEKIDKLIKDAAGDIWLSSWKGIRKYNVANQTSILFTQAQGLNDNFIVDKALTITKGGEILLGQNNGFISFHPDSLCGNTNSKSISLSYLKIIGEEEIIQQPIQGKNKIDLKHTQNYFTIGFNSLAFFQPENFQYSWYLEGYDKEWSTPTNDVKSVNYSKVAPGKYKFHLRSIDYCGNWNEESLQLNIIIHHPWWQSWWAYLIYAFLFLASIFSLFFYQKKKLELNAQLALERNESERLKELDEWKTQFYTNITHEFKMPLTVILGMSSEIEIQHQQKESTKLKRSVDILRRNANQLLFLIKQILDLSKLESQAMPLNLVQGDVISFIKFVTESCQSLAASKDIRLFFSRGTDSINMDFDGEKIQLIIFNLLSNAIKFTPKGGIVNIHVEESLTKGNHILSIAVKDNGIGISKEQLPFIFDRFYQADQSSIRRAEGTGIGLALIKELINLMGGNISVKSTFNEGSTFYVDIPITRNAENIKHDQEASNTFLTDLPTDEIIYDEVDSVVDLKNDQYELLIVEDNPDVAHYLKSIFQSSFKINIAKNGVDGIRKATEQIPDIIISDVMMPEKDGFELCDALKQDERTSHIPIILLTAKAEQKDKIQGLKFGADAYISKPFDKKELILRVENLINLRLKLQMRYRNFEKPDQEQDEIFNINNEFILKVKKTIEENLDNENFGVEDLAKLVFLSRTQVHRKIKALTGRSTGHFIRAIRLKQAMIWLKKSDKSISQIAYDTGFKTLPYFSRVFTEAYGKPPSSFRK